MKERFPLQIGDKVLTHAHGVCRVAGVSAEQFEGKRWAPVAFLELEVGRDRFAITQSYAMRLIKAKRVQQP